MIKNIFKILSQYLHIRKIYGNASEKKLFDGRSVVFNTVRVNPFQFGSEVFLAAIMAKNGAKAYVLIDDGVLFHHDTKQYSNNFKFKNIKPYSSIVYKLKAKYFTLLAKWAYNNKIIFINYSEIFNNISYDSSDVIKKIKNKNIDLHGIVDSSVKRFFKRDSIDYNELLCKEYYEMTQSNAIMSYLVGEYISEFIKPTTFITGHGIYSTWGPCFEYLKKIKHIKSSIYSPNGYKPGEMIFHREIHQIPDMTDEIKAFMPKNLNLKQKNDVTDFFNLRLSKNSIDTKIYYKELDTYSDLDKINKPIFIAFPSVAWEGDIAERNILFDGLTSWLVETICFFKKHPEIHLVIRFHPSESTLYKLTAESKQGNLNIPLENLIREKIPEIDKINNLSIIHSTQYVDSYKLIKEKMSVGLIYRGMLALETVFLGKPLILCARGMYSNNGLAFEPKSKKDYFSLFNDVDELISGWDENYRRNIAIKLCRWYMFEVSMTFPSLSNDIIDSVIDLYLVNKDNIDLKNNINFKKLVSYLM